MKQRRYTDDYRHFLDRFADRLVTQATLHALPRISPTPTLTSIQDAFAALRSAAGLEAWPTVGPDAAHFVFVAAAQREIAPLRATVDCYGQAGWSWQPFHPDVKKRIGIIAMEVAAEADLHYQPIPVGQGLLEHLRRAEDSNTIVLIVVDPWTIKIDSYRTHMADFDQQIFANCGLLVPWNQNDSETVADREALQAGLSETFPRVIALNSTYVRDAIGSADELKRELMAAVGEIRRRMLQYAKVYRKIDGGGSGGLPPISGPGGLGS
jgi:FxsC-like protein